MISTNLLRSFLFGGFLTFALPVLCFGQLSITTPGVTVTQDFSIGSTASAALPTGFKIGANWSGGGTTTTLAAGTSGTGALTGTSSGGIYNFADGVTASSTDRAVGFLNSGSFASPQSITFAFTNNTAFPITGLDITFDYEKYRTGSRAFNWTFFHGAASSPTTSAASGDQAYAADGGNTVANPSTSISKTVNLTGLSIAVGSTYYFRWTFTGVGGNTNGQGIGIDNFSLTPTAVLPIELTNFMAKAIEDKKALLSFTTATETNNAFFSIERSQDGTRFEAIGKVTGAGTSTVKQDYTFTDERPLKGTNFYRLKQVDFDGQFSYSPVVSVNIGKVGGIKLSPQPVLDRLTVALEQPTVEAATWQVYDFAGRLLQSGAVEAESTNFEISTVTLTEGSYVLRLVNGQQIITQQFQKN